MPYGSDNSPLFVTKDLKIIFYYFTHFRSSAGLEVFVLFVFTLFIPYRRTWYSEICSQINGLHLCQRKKYQKNEGFVCLNFAQNRKSSFTCPPTDKKLFENEYYINVISETTSSNIKIKLRVFVSGILLEIDREQTNKNQYNLTTHRNKC